MPEPQLDSQQADFLSAYRRGDLAEFFALAPDELEKALALPRPQDRAALAGALRSYSERIGAPAAVFEQLGRLEHPESRMVVTGQQPGFLLGPMFTLSKAVSALSLARRLDSEARPVLPVFWVASQDHDSEEIRHAHLLDLDERLWRFSLPLPEGRPSGKFALEPAWLEKLHAELERLKVPAAHLREVLAWLDEAAQDARSFADWFARLLTRLLGERGLVVLDPLEPELARLFAPTLRRELAAPLESSAAITEAAARLRERGFAPQLGRAGGASNLFLEEEDGQRRLLHYGDGTFASERRRYARAELEQLLADDPTRLTPAAGLRPITQDAALPTAVIVVGPGELRYFAQLRQVYERHGVAMPLVWPRMSVTVLEPPARRILEKFELEPEALTEDFAAASERVLLELHGYGQLFSEALAELERSLASLNAAVRGIDPTLEGAVEKTERRLRRSVELLRHKTARALAERDDIYTRQLARLRAHLLPEGQPQERLVSPVSFFLKFGLAPVLDALCSLPAEGEHSLRF